MRKPACVKSASWAVEEDLRQPARFGPAERVRHGHELAFVNRHELGLAAPSDDRHHAVARGKPVGPGPESCHLARELEAGDVLRRARRSGVATAFLHHVRAVEARGAHAH